jgi:hypothetical protein
MRPDLCGYVFAGERDMTDLDTLQSDLLILRQLVAEYAGNDGFAAYDRMYEAIARTEKTDAETIKAIIWKHWNNKNGQTLEERFTSTADEIARALPAPPGAGG